MRIESKYFRHEAIGINLKILTRIRFMRPKNRGEGRQLHRPNQKYLVNIPTQPQILAINLTPSIISTNMTMSIGVTNKPRREYRSDTRPQPHMPIKANSLISRP